jgi:hypothetical protein
MNRKDFLKRLGLLSTAAVATPILLSSKDDKPKIQITSSSYPDHGLGVERMRFYSNGSVIMRDGHGNIIYQTPIKK